MVNPNQPNNSVHLFKHVGLGCNAGSVRCWRRALGPFWSFYYLWCCCDFCSGLASVNLAKLILINGALCNILKSPFCTYKERHVQNHRLRFHSAPRQFDFVNGMLRYTTEHQEWFEIFSRWYFPHTDQKLNENVRYDMAKLYGIAA